MGSGHVFRVHQANTGVLIAEHTVTTSKTVVVQSCIEAQERASETVFEPTNVQETLRLVHEQERACGPEADSSKWSCVRKVMPDAVSERPRDLFGFQEDDKLGNNPEFANRKSDVPLSSRSVRLTALIIFCT